METSSRPLGAGLEGRGALLFSSLGAGQEAWTPTRMVGVPPGRKDHTAVWTGTKMARLATHGGTINVKNGSAGAVDLLDLNGFQWA